jgi:hypothetical protein
MGFNSRFKGLNKRLLCVIAGFRRSALLPFYGSAEWQTNVFLSTYSVVPEL